MVDPFGSRGYECLLRSPSRSTSCQSEPNPRVEIRVTLLERRRGLVPWPAIPMPVGIRCRRGNKHFGNWPTQQVRENAITREG